MTTKQLRNKILDLAIHGRLVPQDPNDEPASVLLSRIHAEKKKLVDCGKLKKKDLATTPVNDEDKPFDVPEGWEWVTVRDVCSKIGSGSTPRGSNYSEEGIPFFRSQNVYNYGLVYDDIKYISESTHQSMIGTEVLANDLLLNITGGSLGRCAVVPEDFERGNVSQHVCILRTVLVLPAFLHCFVTSSYFAETMILSGSGREGLPKYSLEAMFIPLPPLAEQERIVAAVEQWMSLIDIIESGQENLQQSIALAKNKILDLAIKGKLVENEGEWEEKTLGDACKIVMGQSPCGESLNNCSGIEFHQGKLSFGEMYLEESGVFTSEGSKYAEPDSVVLCVRAPVGIPNITKRRICIGRGLCALHCEDKIELHFLYYALLTLRTYFEEKATGSTFKAISGDTIKKAPIPLPPLTEQSRIVAKVEELFAQFDSIAGALK